MRKPEKKMSQTPFMPLYIVLEYRIIKQKSLIMKTYKMIIKEYIIN